MAKISPSTTRNALIVLACLAVVGVVALRARYGMWRVPQRGMYPGITERSYVVGKRSLLLDEQDLHRGDVVIFRAQRGGVEYHFVWRIIGLPRDTIAIHNDVVEVNGAKVPQRHVDTVGDVDIREEGLGTTTYRIAIDADPSAEREFAPTVVPDGTFFLLGDNRHAASDSRTSGPVPLEAIIARVMSVFDLPPY